MITKIRIRNFRHFEDVTFTPYESTSLLCGLNGTGKSSIVELMYRVQKLLVSGTPIESVFKDVDIPKWQKTNITDSCTALGQSIFFGDGYSDPLSYHNTTSASVFHITLELDKNIFEYYLSFCSQDTQSECLSLAILETLTCNDNVLLRNISGDISIEDGNNEKPFKTDATISAIRLTAKYNSLIQLFLNYITSILSVSINPMNMDSSYHKHNPFLDFSGQNFPSWYAYHASKSPSKIASAFKEYKAFIYGFVEISYNGTQTPVPLYANIKLSHDKNYELPFEALSHGQKVLCVLHTIIKVVPENSTVLIDEFENYLSPSELVPLFSAMQDAYEERNIHFILVSHHPKTLNWYKNSAFILSFSHEKATVILEPFDAEKYGEIDEYLDEQAGG